MSYYVIKNKHSIPRFLFVAVASWVISFGVLTVTLLMVSAINRLNSDLLKSLPWPVSVPLGLWGFYSAFGAFALYMIMWAYWAALERSMVGRAAWFLVLLFGLPWGAAIYALVAWMRDFKKVNGEQPLQNVAGG